MPTDQSLLHLLHMVSPALPVGAYAYSQGLETAVEEAWVNDIDSAEDWIGNIMLHSLAQLDAPILLRSYTAWLERDWQQVMYWNHLLQAARESKELLLEDVQMGQALMRLLRELDVPATQQWSTDESPSFITAFALAACHWRIQLKIACKGFIWSWLENQVAGAIKIVPLGQTQAQKLLLKLMPKIEQVINRAESIGDDDIGSGLPRLALASMQHETQYSRLFRS